MPPLADHARKYLLAQPGVTEQILNNHLEAWKTSKPATINDIYLQLLRSSVNRRGMPNVIGKIERMHDALNCFSPEVVAQRSPENILSDLQARRIAKADPGHWWKTFIGAASTGAKFLQAFKTAEDFRDFVDSFQSNPHKVLALPLLLKEEIVGFGFALACDFLKETGHQGYIKPDVHINAICSAAKVTNAASDIGIFKDVLTYCQTNGLVPYEFDKLLWLVGTGNFHLNGLRVNTNRDAFIQSWMLDQQGKVL